MHAQTRRFRRVTCHQRDTGHAQHAHQHEQTFHANPTGQHGRKHQADGKRQTDAQTNHRHGTRADFFARQIRQQRRNRCAHRTCTLHGTRANQRFHRIGRRRPKAAQRKHRHTQINHLLAADFVGQHPQRQLQQGLRQPIGRHHHPHLLQIRLRHFVCVQCQHGQHQKHAEHPQRIHARKRRGGAPFLCKHLYFCFSGHNIRSVPPPESSLHLNTQNGADYSIIPNTLMQVYQTRANFRCAGCFRHDARHIRANHSTNYAKIPPIQPY